MKNEIDYTSAVAAVMAHKAKKAWAEKPTLGKRCAAVYSDGTRCRFENGHMGKHSG